MPRVDSPYAPHLTVATFATLWLATGCGPTLQSSARLEELETARQTAEAAAEAARSAEEQGDRVVLYASSTAGRQTGPDTEQPPTEPSPPADESPTETPDDPSETDRDGEAAAAETRLRTFVIERGENRVDVLHAPYEKDRAVAAFQRAIETLRSPEALPTDGQRRAREGDESPYADWDADWSPDRVELDELAVTGDDGVELRGTAASDGDVEELITRLNSLPAFSDVAVESTGSVTDGQGVVFRITGTYRTDASQN